MDVSFSFFINILSIKSNITLHHLIDIDAPQSAGSSDISIAAGGSAAVGGDVSIISGYGEVTSGKIRIASGDGIVDSASSGNVSMSSGNTSIQESGSGKG